MPVGVVCELEVVEIERQHGSGAARARRVAKLAIELADQAPAVVDSRQRVLVHEPLETQLHLLAFADVADERERAGVVAVVGPDRSDRQERPDLAAVLAAQAQLELLADAIRPDREEARSLSRLGRLHEVEHEPAEQLLRPAAEHLADRPVGERRAVVGIQHPHAFAGRVDEVAVALFRAAHRGGAQATLDPAMEHAEGTQRDRRCRAGADDTMAVARRPACGGQRGVLRSVAGPARHCGTAIRSRRGFPSRIGAADGCLETSRADLEQRMRRTRTIAARGDDPKRSARYPQNARGVQPDRGQGGACRRPPPGVHAPPGKHRSARTVAAARSPARHGPIGERSAGLSRAASAARWCQSAAAVGRRVRRFGR